MVRKYRVPASVKTIQDLLASDDIEHLVADFSMVRHLFTGGLIVGMRDDGTVRWNCAGLTLVDLLGLIEFLKVQIAQYGVDERGWGDE